MKKIFGSIAVLSLLIGFVIAGFFIGDQLLAQGGRTTLAFLNPDTKAPATGSATFTAKEPMAESSDQAISGSAIPSLSSIFPDISLANLPIFLDTLSVILEMYQEDSMVKQDFSRAVYAVGYCLSVEKKPDGHNAWDTRAMTDWERMLYCLEEILQPQNKEKLKSLVLRVMKAAEGLKGADLIYGVQYSLGTLYKYRNPKTGTIMDLEEIDYALYRCLMQLNENAKPRDKDKIKMSTLQSTLLAVDGLGRLIAPLQGASAKNALSLITLDPTGPDVKTRSDMLEFMGGLLGKSMYYYPKSYHNKFSIGKGEYRPYPDPLKGADWFFYDQKLTLAGILPLKGLNGLLYLVKNFTVADYVISAITENMDALYVASGSTGEAYSMGERNRLLTVVGPVLNYLYDMGYIEQSLQLAASLNEIPLKSYRSVAKYNGNASLYQTNLGTVLEAVQGPCGYGLPYYMMRGASDERYNNEADMVDPALDLLVRVFYKLSRTPYGKSNLLRCMNDEINKINLSGVDEEDIVNKICRENGPVDILYRFLHENHSQLAQLGAGWGKVMLAMADQKDKDKNLFYTSDFITLFQVSLFPALSREMKNNNSVVKSMADNIRKMVESGVSGSAATVN